MEILKLLITNGLLAFIGVIVGIAAEKLAENSKTKQRLKNLEKDSSAQKKENCILCYGLMAALDGLEQLGANHTVPLAKEKIQKHLNKVAHNEED